MVLVALGELLIYHGIVVVCVTRFRPWEVQLLLKDAFPSLPSVLVQLCYCVSLSLLVLLVVFWTAFSLYYAPYELNMTGVTAFFFAVYIVMCFSLFYQHVYLPSNKWQVSLFYCFCLYAGTALYFAMQLVACFYLQDFDERAYSAVYMEINFFFFSFGIHFILTDECIEVREFCFKFIEYLEKVVRQEEVKELEDCRSEEPSVPEERPREQRRAEAGEHEELVNATVNPLPLIPLAREIDCGSSLTKVGSRCVRNTGPLQERIPCTDNSKEDLTKIVGSIKKKSTIFYILIATNIGTFGSLIAYSTAFMYLLKQK